MAVAAAAATAAAGLLLVVGLLADSLDVDVVADVDDDDELDSEGHCLNMKSN